MKSVHVAVGVIKNSEGKILIAKRPEKSHQGGLWEFPGGKVEANETLFNALQRELKEELGLTIYSSSPLIKIAHDYGDKKVLLDVHWVTEFDNASELLLNNVGSEGQPISWVDIASLNQFEFPAANIPIINAIQLPTYYAITGSFGTQSECLAKIENLLQRKIKLIQLRAKDLAFDDYRCLANSALDLCKSFGAQLQLNLRLEEFYSLNLIDEKLGLHLRASELNRLNRRPITDQFWLSASCHSLDEIERVKNVGVDFICLSPVLKTNSHPDAECLGWNNFSELSVKAGCPVFALGGMAESDLSIAVSSGAQGIAAISAWWKN